MLPALLLALALGGVEVHGTTTCPSPDQVYADLTPLLPAGPAPNARVYLSGTREGGLTVELRDSEGELLGTRNLAPQSDCAALAQAAALVVAVWARDRQSNVELGLSRLPPPPRSRLILDGGVAYAASLGGGFTSGVVGELSMGVGGPEDPGVSPASSVGWGGRLAFTWISSRDQRVGSGKASWTRLGPGLGPRYRLAAGPIHIEGHVQVQLGVVHAVGQELRPAAKANGFDPGLGGGLQLVLPGGPLAPFVGVTGLGWLAEQRLNATGAPPIPLPRWDVQVLVGILVGRF
jgi:hypothetical protein